MELSGGTAKALRKPTHVQSISCLDEGSVPSTPTHCYGSISLIRFSQRLAALSHARTSGLIRGFRSTLLRPHPGTGTRSRDPARRGPSAAHKAPTPSSAWVPPTRGPEDWPPSRDRGIRRSSWLSVPCTCGRIQALPLEAAVCHATNPDSLTKTSSAPSVCDGRFLLPACLKDKRLSWAQRTFGLIRGFRSTLLRSHSGTGSRSHDVARGEPIAAHKTPTPSRTSVPLTRVI